MRTKCFFLNEFPSCISQISSASQEGTHKLKSTRGSSPCLLCLTAYCQWQMGRSTLQKSEFTALHPNPIIKGLISKCSLFAVQRGTCVPFWPDSSLLGTTWTEAFGRKHAVRRQTPRHGNVKWTKSKSHVQYIQEPGAGIREERSRPSYFYVWDRIRKRERGNMNCLSHTCFRTGLANFQSILKIILNSSNTSG